MSRVLVDAQEQQEGFGQKAQGPDSHHVMMLIGAGVAFIH